MIPRIYTNSHVTKRTHTNTHSLQVKTTILQDKHKIIQSKYNQFRSVNAHTRYICPQEIHRNSLNVTEIKKNHFTYITSVHFTSLSFI